MLIYRPVKARVHIKGWLDRDSYFNDAELVDQVEGITRLPFVFHHVVLSADAHTGYAMPIGGVVACTGVVVPSMVGSDIACGMRYTKTNIKVADVTRETIVKLITGIKKVVPIGNIWHKEPQDKKYLPFKLRPSISAREYDKALHYIGTLGGGNHFIQLSEDGGYLSVMLHSGSRNLGDRIYTHYHKVAQKLNDKWYSTVPKELAFLPLDTEEGQDYLNEMQYAILFAECNRKLMMLRIKEVITEEFPMIMFDDDLDVNHNYARMENHFGKNVMVHRKGAISVREGKLGIIPSDQGSLSYIVRGKGNPDSFMSCSHGAGRAMSRREAKRVLNFDEEVAKLDGKGIVHSLTGEEKLDEAISCYKNIDEVMANQTDLVDVVSTLQPLGVIKG